MTRLEVEGCCDRARETYFNGELQREGARLALDQAGRLSLVGITSSS